MKPNYTIVFNGLPSQEFALDRSQEFGFGASLKRKVLLITYLGQGIDLQALETTYLTTSALLSTNLY